MNKLSILLLSIMFFTILAFGPSLVDKLKVQESMVIKGTVRYSYHVDSVGQESAFNVTTEHGEVYRVVMKTEVGTRYDTDYPSVLKIVKETFIFAPSHAVYRLSNIE